MATELNQQITTIIIYNKFFDKEGDTIIVGGIETYLQNLALLLIRMGHSVYIFQPFQKDFRKVHMGITIIG